MKPAAYTINLGRFEAGLPIGGKYGATVQCPICKRAGVLFRRYFSQREQRTLREYAHVLSFDLNAKNEPVMRAGDLCHAPDDPSPKPPRGSK